MQNSFENRLLVKGMNLDKSPEFIEQGEYTFGLNVRPVNTERGSIGVITNVEGNVLAEYIFPEDVPNNNFFARCVGSKLDYRRRAVYFMVYISFGPSVKREDSYVLRFNINDRTVDKLFGGANDDTFGFNLLEFSRDVQIQAIDIAYDDQSGDTLLWTDGKTEPKKLNVRAAYNRFNVYKNLSDGPYETGDISFADIGATNFYTKAPIWVPIRRTGGSAIQNGTYNYATGEASSGWEALDIGICYPPYLDNGMFIQKPVTPYFSPNTQFEYSDVYSETIGSRTALRRSSFQFKYKYVYFDGQESEWSPASEACLPLDVTSAVFQSGEDPIGVNYPDPRSVSVRVPVRLLKVNSTLSTISFAATPMIARVKVAVRRVPLTQAPEDWYLFRDIPWEEWHEWSISTSNISAGFQLGPGTYFYDWDVRSWNYGLFGATGNTTHITVSYTGNETLIPIDPRDSNTNFYPVPLTANTQGIVDNRVIWGAIEEGLEVSQEIIKDIDDNILALPRLTKVEYAEEQLTQLINEFSGSDTQPGVGPVSLSWDSSFDAADFNQPFFYNQTFGFFYEYEIDSVFFPVIRQYNITGTSQGIPGTFASMKEFLEALINAAIQNDPIPIEAGFLSATYDAISNTISFEVDPNLFTTPDSISISVFGDGFTTLATYSPRRTYKNNSIQQLGFVFQDDYGRLTPVITTESMSVEIPHYIDNDLDYTTCVINLRNLSDFDVPEWAKIAHIVRKRSESWQDFFQFPISRGNTVSESWNNTRSFHIGFLNLELDEPTPLPSIQNKKYLYITPNALNGLQGGSYNNMYNIVVGGFAPQSGDTFRFLYRANTDGTVNEKYEDLVFSIVGYNEKFNTIVLDFDEIFEADPYFALMLEGESPNSTSLRILCEVTKGRTTADQEFYWEIAAQLNCENGKININPDRDTLDLFGDVYQKYRGQTVVYIQNGSSSVNANFVVQDKHFNDFRESNNVGEGRPSAFIIPLRRNQFAYPRLFKPNLFRYSEKSIQETDVIRYGTVYDENLQEVDNSFGRIENFDAEGDKLWIYQEDKVCFCAVGRSITAELSGAQRVIASQNQVFSDVVYNPGNFGIGKFSESFAKNGYQKYLVDVPRGAIYRQSMDGFTKISDYGVDGIVNELCKKVSNSVKPSWVRGAFDTRTGEYCINFVYSELVTLPYDLIEGTFEIDEPNAFFQQYELNEVVNEGTGGVIDRVNNNVYRFLTDTEYPEIEIEVYQCVTLAFQEKSNAFTTFYSFKPEWADSSIQGMCTFLNGKIYTHDMGATEFNTFFGRTYNSEIEVVSNQEPEQTKVWNTFASKSNIKPSSVSVSATSEMQTSAIPENSFVFREGVWVSPFYRDSTISISQGPKLRGRWLKAKSVYLAADKVLKVFSLMFNTVKSQFTR